MTAPYQVDFVFFLPARILLIAPADLVPVKEKRGKKKETTERTYQVSCTEYLRDLDLGLGPR